MSRLRPLPSLFIAASLAFAPACTQKKDTTAPAAADTIVAGSASHGDNAINERLERLTERLEKARVEAHVPGMAIAVVKDDVVIFARGFGLADLQSKRPATKDTTFAIGSSTKAFTSALVGTFVDEGKIGWDDEITKHIPEMKLKVRATDRKPTLRDAMSHRTGFTRMGVLWAGGGVTREEMFRTTSSAEPLADYGKTFLYNNVVYASAGEAAARVGGKSWSELISERLLVPLSMSASNTSAKIAKDDPKRAQGYRFDDATGEFEAVPMRDLDLIGPAGSINSSVVDMSQWVRLQLGRGEIDGKRVISKERIEDTWSPQIKVAGSMQYGLGWFVQDWRGHRVIEHGGNIDGYAAAVALLPDDGLGFVLLTNVSATPLQASVRSIVWESMLEPLNPQSAQGSALDPTPFEGKYVADFGPFEDQRFVVSAKDGKLFLDVPGQTNYELLPPDGDDKRRFAVTDQVAASFELGDNGQANLLRLHQGGMDMEMPREGWTAPAEIDLAAHAGHLGSYTSEDGAKTVTVVVRGNRLAVDVPGQMAYELHKPDKDGKWRFRVKKDELAVSFETGKAKKGKSAVVALVMHQGTKDNIRMIRKTGGAKLPTAAELAKLRKAPKREKAIARLGLVEATGTIRLAHSGVQGKITI
ncbi:MAG: beta-lactamase family protein, partial [Nannocystaceae bacterium]|nr:beta-lactamase family protein [Nannocystaceae bacterium]